MPAVEPLPKSRTRIKVERIAPAGDEALVVEFATCISREINERVRELDQALSKAGWPEVMGTVPSYRSLLVYFDPIKISFEELSRRLRTLDKIRTVASRRPKQWTLPVCYGGEYGADLDELATALSMSSEEIIRAHSGAVYTVYMIGFSPGFAYLGELPRILEVPRKAVPKPLVPPNTIQIGGQQTAVSSMPMPSGWYIVGQTPFKLYQPARPKP